MEIRPIVPEPPTDCHRSPDSGLSIDRPYVSRPVFARLSVSYQSYLLRDASGMTFAMSLQK
jgi:hypothetical protein